MALIKKIFFALFILLISAVIFVFLVQDREVKQDILRTTLNLFGDELLAMVPDGEQKTMLEKRYQEFLTRAEKDEVADEEIERVAATILNLTNRDTVISAETAMTVLGISETKGGADPLPKEPPVFRDRGDPELPSSKRRRWRMLDRNARRQKLAERLWNLQQFNETFNQLSEQDSAIRGDLPQYITTADSGIQIALHEDFRSHKLDPRYGELREHVRKLEEDAAIKFHADMAAKKWAELKARKTVLKALQLHETVGLPEAAITVIAKIDSGLLDSIGTIVSDSLERIIDREIEFLETDEP
jgi:hypothetical protein